MTRKTLFLTLTLFALFNVTSSAQFEDGTIAPDFTVSDINGDSHQLYSLIDEGKTVVLSFFWTIDPVSWSNHSQGHLNDVWNQRGPNGTGDYFVIGIEGVASTTLEDLNGTGSNTSGDWVSGTPYPLVNLEAESTLPMDYEINFYPTYYVICPEDTTVRRISVSSLENFTTNNGCTENNTTSIDSELEESEFSIYPNPASEYIQLTLPESITEHSLFTITDFMGKVVFSQKTTDLVSERLPLNHLPKGVYLATLYTNKRSISRRISIQ